MRGVSRQTGSLSSSFLFDKMWAFQSRFQLVPHDVPAPQEQAPSSSVQQMMGCVLCFQDSSQGTGDLFYTFPNRHLPLAGKTKSCLGSNCLMSIQQNKKLGLCLRNKNKGEVSPKPQLLATVTLGRVPT